MPDDWVWRLPSDTAEAPQPGATRHKGDRDAGQKDLGCRTRAAALRAAAAVVARYWLRWSMFCCCRSC